MMLHIISIPVTAADVTAHLPQSMHKSRGVVILARKYVKLMLPSHGLSVEARMLNNASANIMENA